MFKLIIAIWIISTPVLFGQVTYEIKDFSSRYKGLVHLNKETADDIFKKGKIEIIDRQNQKVIIEVTSDELAFDLDDSGHVQTNILDLPYGTQSLLIYEDVNFDGHKDLAIMDGQFSCYHGPSYKIYLKTPTGFKFSPSFTRLSQDYCGMFQIDSDNKRLFTMTKSGCCWHKFSKFKVINNKPVPVWVEIEDMTHFPYYITRKETWKNGKKILQENKVFENEDVIKPVMSFLLQKSHKKVLLFITDDQTLNYCLMRPDQTIEFSFPYDAYSEPNTFKISNDKTYLKFTNKQVTYVIYEETKPHNNKKIGVNVYINGKKYQLKGDPNSLKGSLSDLKDTELENLQKL